MSSRCRLSEQRQPHPCVNGSSLSLSMFDRAEFLIRQESFRGQRTTTTSIIIVVIMPTTSIKRTAATADLALAQEPPFTRRSRTTRSTSRQAELERLFLE